MNEKIIEELEELLSFANSKELIQLNMSVSDSLVKKGVKLRKHKWQELEAS